MEIDKNPKLLEKLNLFDVTLLVIGSVIGSGIFLTSGIIAQSLPSPEWILFVWILGAVLSLFGGLTFAELGAMIPEAGGQYVYLREAYGPLAGFMYGWTAFLTLRSFSKRDFFKFSVFSNTDTTVSPINLYKSISSIKWLLSTLTECPSFNMILANWSYSHYHSNYFF